MRGSGLIGVDLFVKKFPAGVQKVLDILFKVTLIAVGFENSAEFAGSENVHELGVWSRGR